MAIPAVAQTDFSGTYTGSVTITRQKSGCPTLTVNGNAAVTVSQSGGSVSGTFSSDVSEDSTGACPFAAGPFSTSYSGTVSANGITINTPVSGTLLVSGSTMSGSLTNPVDGSVIAVTLRKQGAPSAAGCSLGMTLTCSGGTCTSTTLNNGSNACTGTFIIGMELVQGGGTIGSLTSSLSLSNEECFTFPSPVVPSVTTPISACIGDGSLGPGASFTTSAPVSGSLANLVALTFVVDRNSGEAIGQAYVFNNGLSTPSCTPQASVPPSAQSGTSYTLTWSAVIEPNPVFTVEESTTPDFSAITSTQTTTAQSATFTHSVANNTTYYYRVRANTCNGAPGSNSPTTSIVVQGIPTVSGRQGDVTTPVGSTTPVSIKVFIPAPSGKVGVQDSTFTATTDKSYLTVSPSSGTIPPGGTTVTVTANPSGLPPGANTGTLTVTSNGTTTTKSVSVSLVTPVAPSGKTPPPPNALIIPAVAHAPGALGPFQSDVRLTNASNASVAYQVTFTPTRKDATQNSKTTQITVDAAQTIALNDILRDFFGVGATDDPSDNGQGTLEIRPLNTASTLNFASSRTFTFNSFGTFGQFVAAIPFSAFATKSSVLPPLPGAPPPSGTPTLSLQQVACCAGPFRTNLGVVEGSGQPASGNIKLFDDAGNLLKTVPYLLQPGEHHQDSFANWGLPEVSDGRVEVTVESATGAVTAYASVLDNRTNDPLEVTPVQVAKISATRYIQPGMAALPNGANNFHSDVRIYNGGSAPVSVTPTLYSFLGNPPKTLAPFTIGAGQVKAFDDVVATLFNASGDGGSIVFTTSTPSSLVTTGRTYTIDPTQNNGTFGQFIPGAIASQGVGAGEKPLQILQLEESPNFRSNIGLSELTGNAATVHITAYLPDSKQTVSTDVPLNPNQFVQLNRALAGLFPGQNVYNARVAVEVTGGTGRVAAYGSVIDNKSLDPTYVPAQSAQ